MIQKELFMATGGFDETLPTCEDYDLWLRLACTGRIALLDRRLLKILLNPDGITFSKRIAQMRTVEHIYNRFTERLKFGKEIEKDHIVLKDNRRDNGIRPRLFGYVTKQVITSKKGSVKWLFSAAAAYALYPGMARDRVWHIFMRYLIGKGKIGLFEKFLDVDSKRRS